MCEQKSDAHTKVDKLFGALDRLSSTLEERLLSQPVQRDLELVTSGINRAKRSDLLVDISRPSERHLRSIGAED